MATEFQILQRTEHLLMKFGARSVTMDDVSRDLGISKKTLYKVASDKSDLVSKCCHAHFSREKMACLHIYESSTDAIDQMLSIFHHVNSYLGNINPSLMYDLQKYYPESWAMFEDYKNNFILSMVKQNIGKGIKQGFYRRDFNAEIIARLYVNKIEMVLDPRIFPPRQFSISKLYKEYILHHLRGIVTPKGMLHLQKLIKTKKIK